MQWASSHLVSLCCQKLIHGDSENLYRARVPPPIKHLCYAALADLFKYLPESKANPQDVAVRQKLQLASWMSLWPIKLDGYAAVGLSHALGHKLGASYHIPHGITSVCSVRLSHYLFTQNIVNPTVFDSSLSRGFAS